MDKVEQDARALCLAAGKDPDAILADHPHTILGWEAHIADKLLLVIQADRDAAATFGRFIGRLTARDADAIRAGDWDKTEDVQAFARHRLSTDAEVLRERQEYSPADDENSRAFIDGWNARLDHTDFDMALHYWMLAGAALSPTIDSADVGREA